MWDAGRRLRERGASLGVYLQAIARALRPLEDADWGSVLSRRSLRPRRVDNAA